MNLLSMALNSQSLSSQIVIIFSSSLLVKETSHQENVTVAYMLSRDSSQVTNKMCQLQHKTLPPHIEFMQLKPTNTLNQIDYLVKHEDVFRTQKMIHIQSQLVTVIINLRFVIKIKVILLHILL